MLWSGDFAAETDSNGIHAVEWRFCGSNPLGQEQMDEEEAGRGRGAQYLLSHGEI